MPPLSKPISGLPCPPPVAGFDIVGDNLAIAFGQLMDSVDGLLHKVYEGLVGDGERLALEPDEEVLDLTA